MCAAETTQFNSAQKKSYHECVKNIIAQHLVKKPHFPGATGHQHKNLH